MRIGAHVRDDDPIGAARERGAEVVQFFVTDPQGWKAPKDHPQAEALRAGDLTVFVHSSYLINIASPDDGFLTRSAVLARRELEAAAEIGAQGLIVHAGAGGGASRGGAVERAAASVLAIAGEEDLGPEVVLELTAGGGESVAATISQVSALVDALGGDPRVGLCLDTCHLFAAGYPLDDPSGAGQPFDELRERGLDGRLRVLHANDARDARGSRRDRHAHVGTGEIGEAGFAAILADPLVRRLPILIETPGHEEEDRVNLATLRRLAAV